MRKPAKRVSHDVAYPDTAPKRGSVWLDKAYLGYYALCGRVFVLAVVSSQLFVPNGAVSSAGHVRSLMQSLKFSLRKTDYVGCTRFSETTNYKQQDHPTFHNALRASGHAISLQEPQQRLEVCRRSRSVVFGRCVSGGVSVSVSSMRGGGCITVLGDDGLRLHFHFF